MPTYVYVPIVLTSENFLNGKGHQTRDSILTMDLNPKWHKLKDVHIPERHNQIANNKTYINTKKYISYRRTIIQATVDF